MLYRATESLWTGSFGIGNENNMVDETTKCCTKCGECKPISLFYERKRRGTVDGYQAWCKKCHAAYVQEWFQENRDKMRAYSREYRHNNAEKCRAASERWRKNKGLEWFRKKEAKRRLDIKIKISGSISGRIWETLKRGSKANRHWEELVGYTVDQLKAHLEKLFKPGMTWENYGTYWHIDHKTPIAVFNFQKPEDIDFRLCWSLKNLRPLEATKNMSKGAKIHKPFQPSLAIGVR